MTLTQYEDVREELKLNTDPHICDRDTFVRLLQQKYAAGNMVNS